MAAAGDPAGRTGEHGAGGEAHGLGDRRDAAVGLHDQDRARVARLRAAARQAREVARQRRADVGVDDGGTHPLVLLDLRQHLRRERHVGARQRGARPPRPRALVPRVAIGVEVADRDRLDALAPRASSMRRVERRRSSGVCTRPSARTRSRTPSRSCARHQRLGRRHAQVVAIVLEALAHLEHVAMALGREQPDPGTLALEQRIGRDRRAVDDPLGLARAGAASRGRASRPGAPAPLSRPATDRRVEAALAMVTRAVARRPRPGR